MSTVTVAPPPNCNLADGGKWLMSGMPESTIVAPAQDGSNLGTPIAAAISASSSSDNKVNCRVFRIAVPRRYKAVTRLHDGRVSPE